MANSDWIVTFNWCYAHLGLVGWPGLMAFAWKTSQWFNETKNQILKTVGQVDKMSTNCFPTMESSLKTQDNLLHSMDASLKTMVERMPEKVRTVAVGRRRKSQ